MNEIIRFGLDDRERPRISVFKRGDIFYARFRLGNRAVSGGRLYITETLKTTDAQVAQRRAQERFVQIQIAEHNGTSVRTNTVEEAIDSFVADYEKKLAAGIAGHSAPMLRGFRKTICRYWREYIGRKQLADVNLHDMEAYEGWRQGYWQRWLDSLKNQSRSSLLKRGIRSQSDGTIKLPSNARLRPTHRTIVWEVNAFKQFLKWCERSGTYKGNAIQFAIKKGPISRRSGFTSAEWTRLHSAMRRKAWRSEVGKHANDPRLARYREMLRAYVLFMANTCLRPGESRNLTWDSITWARNNAGEEICKIWVAQSYSKVGERREVIGMPTAARVMRELYESRKARGGFWRKTDYIWCDERGRVIGDFREGFNNLLRLANCEFDRDGRKHTIYSLRHYGISEQLRNGTPIYEIATNCGTSVEMIEKYYSDARSPDFVDNLTKSRYRDRRTKVAHA